MARLQLLYACSFLLLSVAFAQSSIVSSDGFCSPSSNTNATCSGSTYGNCCSSRGYCGATTEYCGAGCQSAFGSCYVNADRISSDGFCGGSAGQICLGSIFGSCCSANGYCGNGTDYCSTGCQSSFGSCGDAAATPSTTESSTPTSTSSSALASTSDSSSTSTAATTSQPSALATTSPLPSSGGSRSRTNTGAIAGGVVGGILFLAIIIAAAFLIRRERRKGKRMARSEPGPGPYEAPSSMGHPVKSDTDGLVELPSDHDRLQELHGNSAKGYASYEVGEGKTPIEKTPMNSTLVDDRVSKGYDGAYRGN